MPPLMAQSAAQGRTARQLSSFVHHINCVDAGVVLHWNERNHELTLCVRLQTAKGFVERPVGVTRFFKYVEVAQQRNAVRQLSILSRSSRSAGSGRGHT